LKSSADGSLEELLKCLREHRKNLEDELGGLYLSYALTNRYVLHPARLKEIARDDVDQYLSFLDSSNEQEAIESGKTRASEGLSLNVFIKMGSLLRLHTLRQIDQQNQPILESTISLIDTFMSARILGYFEQFEVQLLDDQEKMRIALARAEQIER
jgi:hypothetical protein